MRPRRGDAVIRVLAGASWLAWAAFALALAAEIAGRACGRPVPRLRAAAPVQALAAAVAGAAVLAACTCRGRRHAPPTTPCMPRWPASP